MKMGDIHTSRAVRAVAVAVMMTIALLLLCVARAYAAQYGGGNVQGYAAEQPIDNGTIVQLSGEGSGKVKAVAQENLQNMFGVTVDRRRLLCRTMPSRAATLERCVLRQPLLMEVARLTQVQAWHRSSCSE